MKVRFVGDPEAYSLPWGTEFSFTLEEIKAVEKSCGNFMVKFLGGSYDINSVNLVAIAPETPDDIEYLQSLRKEILRHKKILLGNVDTNVYGYFNTGDSLGRWIYENEEWDKINGSTSHPCGRWFWHYIVSEIVKAEDIPYYELKAYKMEGLFPEYGLYYMKDDKWELLETFDDIKCNPALNIALRQVMSS